MRVAKRRRGPRGVNCCATLQPVVSACESLGFAPLSIDRSVAPQPPPQAPPEPVRPPRVAPVRAPKRLPSSLQSLGNGTSWQKVLDHLRTDVTSRRPLVVWGPTGCGKSRGVAELLTAMNYRVVTLDGSDGDDTNQLVTWIKRTRDVKIARGATALVLDDFESFTSDARRRVTSALRVDASTRLAPVVVTCTQLRDPRVRDLAGFDDVRLFAPNEHVCKEWFDRNGVSVEYVADGVARRRRETPPPRWHVENRDCLHSGDLRRVETALRWRLVTGQALASGAPTIAFVDSFQATRSLLQRNVNVDRWASNVEARDVELVREHLPKYVDDDVEALGEAMDGLSAACWPVPARYELAQLQIPLQLALVGLTARLHSKARDVGALFPPSLPAPTWGRTRETPSETDRPRTTLEWIEIPRPLRDRA